MESTLNEVVSAPKAAVLIESMRDIGYTLESAIADLIDNSISAGARNIGIRAEIREFGPYIAIVDDGRGMSSDELIQALRLGSQSPLETRAHADLGRFGLGLKTASFSQCRKLTVISRQNGRVSGACWDLDRIVATDEWILQILDEDLKQYSNDLADHDGTLVIWERVDRIVGTLGGEQAKDAFTQRMASACDHLALVFHRFLKPDGKSKPVRILVNDGPVEPFDPFLSSHSGTTRIPLRPEPFTYDGKTMIIQGYTLPHYSRISKSLWEEAEGSQGYLRSQGFYVYRERRLIIWGTWFNLIKASERTKLARVRIDITNDQDEDWKIDVRKSSAQPPPQVRRRLRELVNQLTSESHTRIRRTPRKLASEDRAALWERSLKDDQFRYTVNQGHPLVSHLADRLDGEMAGAWQSLLTLLSASLPVDAIVGDMSVSPKDSAQLVLPDDDLSALTLVMVSALTSQGLDEKAVKDSLRYSEPFRSNWENVSRVIDQHFGRRSHG